MSDAIITLLDIDDRVPYIYNTNEGWVMRSKYVNTIVTILPIIYKKDKM
jgi:hypothetical protein